MRGEACLVIDAPGSLRVVRRTPEFALVDSIRVLAMDNEVLFGLSSVAVLLAPAVVPIIALSRARLALFSRGSVADLFVAGTGRALKVFFSAMICSSFFCLSSRCAFSFAAIASPGRTKVEVVGSLTDLVGTNAGLFVDRPPLGFRFCMVFGNGLPGEFERDIWPREVAETGFVDRDAAGFVGDLEAGKVFLIGCVIGVFAVAGFAVVLTGETGFFTGCPTDGRPLVGLRAGRTPGDTRFVAGAGREAFVLVAVVFFFSLLVDVVVGAVEGVATGFSGRAVSRAGCGVAFLSGNSAFAARTGNSLETCSMASSSASIASTDSSRLRTGLVGVREVMCSTKESSFASSKPPALSRAGVGRA